MTGAVYARTPNLGLGLIEFNFPNWGDDANDNTKIIDAGFSVVGISVKGAWTNNTPYNTGDLVVDTDLNSIWRAQVNHTSAATGTFAEDRAAHPTYWIDASQALHARGQWATATTYYINDVVYKDANKYSWALATRQFISSGSYDTDVANGDFVIITDLTQTVADAEAAKDAAETAATQSASSASAAATSATNAQNSATAAAGSATNAANSASAANTSATNAAASASAAATSATNAANSATAADASADAAQAALEAMMPDAPSDGKTYGRQNAAWVESVSKAYADAQLALKLNLSGGTLTGPLTLAADPAAALQAATKQYVDAKPAGAVISDTPPGSPSQGQTWWESDSGAFFIWYDDGNTAQWVQVNGPSVGTMGAYAPGTVVFHELDLSGTYTKPAGLKSLEVWVVGGGGGSANCSTTVASQNAASGGGGAGGVVYKCFTADDVPASVAYTIGSGGAIGGAGSASQWNSSVPLVGGGGLTSTNTGAGTTYAPSGRGSGGGASGGDINMYGGQGEQGIRCAHNSLNAYAGSGGCNCFTFYSSQLGIYTSSALAGIAGHVPGGGAMGSANGQNQAASAGGLGGDGRIYLKEHF